MAGRPWHKLREVQRLEVAAARLLEDVREALPRAYATRLEVGFIARTTVGEVSYPDEDSVCDGGARPTSPVERGWLGVLALANGLAESLMALGGHYRQRLDLDPDSPAEGLLTEMPAGSWRGQWDDRSEGPPPMEAEAPPFGDGEAPPDVPWSPC